MTNGHAAGSSTRHPRATFVIYADRRLQKPDIIDALKTAFVLTESELIVRIRSDSHYR